MFLFFSFIYHCFTFTEGSRGLLQDTMITVHARNLLILCCIKYQELHPVANKRKHIKANKINNRYCLIWGKYGFAIGNLDNEKIPVKWIFLDLLISEPCFLCEWLKLVYMHSMLWPQEKKSVAAIYKIKVITT